jgi:AAA family ATP:ADP antiporter
VLRDIKDVLVLTTAGEPFFVFLKTSYFLFSLKLVCLGLFLLFYRKNNLPTILFVSVVSPLIIFIFFHFWIFQRAAFFHPDPSYVQELLQNHRGMGSLIEAYGNWTYACYYLLVDLWQALTIGFLFWAVVNQTFTLKEAKLSYPLLGFVFPSLGMLVGGLFFGTVPEGIPYDFENTMRTSGFVLLGGLILFVLASWRIKKLKLTNIPIDAVNMEPLQRDPSFKWIYLFLIFVIMTSFTLCGHLLQLLFKTQLRHLSPSTDAYGEFLGQYSLYAGCSSIVLFLLTFWMIWKFGWLKSALLPPLYLLISTGFLLLYLHFSAEGNAFGKVVDSNFPIVLWVFVIQFLIFTGLKTLFFATKEMAYIPLGLTTKARGKAVVDFLLVGTGVWLGFVLPFLFNLFPIEKNIESMLLIIIGATILWIISVIYLGKMFKKISGE